MAVLPFTNNSSDPENEYFSDGITEEVINALGRVEGLRVTARTSAFAFKGASRDIRDIGRALNVGAILEGSVRKSGNRLRISAQLIDVHGGVLLWSERYDRDLEDIFVVQDEIATIIAGCLQAKLSPPASRPGSAQSLAAYDAYLRGRFYWNKGTSESCRTSVEHFERAIAIDKGYARAYAGIAEALVYSALLGASAAETFPRARTFAQQAIALDPSLADAHATLAYIQFWFDWQWDEADRGFRRAIKLNPNSAAAHNYYSVFLANLGRTDEAIAQSQLTLELDPLWVNAHQSYGWALLVGERYADSVKASDGALELAPEYVLAYASKGMALLEMGSAGDALATFERVREPDDPFRLAGLACCSARSGRLSDARELVDRMVQLAEQGKMLPSWVTLGYCALGDVDQAFHWLERGIRLRDPFVVCMPSFVWYDPMRADPRFDQLLESLNFPPASLTRAAIRRQRTGVPEAPSGYNLTV